MIKLEEILNACTDKQLEDLHTHSYEIVRTIETATGLKFEELYGESETYSKILIFELAAFDMIRNRAKGLQPHK